MVLKRNVLGWIAVLLVTAAPALGTRITLKDGTILEGTVIRAGDGYWIKTSDGNSKTIPADQVSSVISDAPDGISSSGTPTDPSAGASAAFRAARNRVSEVETALAAVSIWQEFADKYPQSSDLASAEIELDHWKKLAADGAEKINGVWVGGDKRKQIISQADSLTRQAVHMLDQGKALQAIDKLQESAKIYPNSFLTNYLLGNVAMGQKNYDQASIYFVTASRLNPQSAEAVNNLAVANFFRKRFDIAIDGFMSAVKIQDTKEVVQNLVTALALAPSDLRTLPRMKQTLGAANLLASGYNIQGPSGEFLMLPPPVLKSGDDSGTTSSTMAWSGSGFFINDEGLILTNRHVAKGAKHLLVELSDGSLPAAEVVAIDDAYDLALLKIKPKGKVPFIHLSPLDSPNEGADCTVMGFPMVDELGFDLKITRGIVSSAQQDAGSGADILTDAKVNPGNSGGPIIDRFGNAMAIVCMKRVSEGEIDGYGIGISAGHIREFLKRQKVETIPGTRGDAPLSTEDMVARLKAAAVCVRASN